MSDFDTLIGVLFNFFIYCIFNYGYTIIRIFKNLFTPKPDYNPPLILECFGD